MEKINLHFTGDFHAITSANNMISALLDNYLYQHQAEGFGLKQILWKRVMVVNDRSLRHIVTGLGPHSNGLVQESGFDITPASEIMAILCLSRDIDDLRRRIENILLGYTLDNKPFTVKDMGVAGAIVALLLDAMNPKFPVCIAKTQYSFSQDPKLYGAPEGFEFDIKDVVINAGAEMIVAIAGDIIRMPGLPKSPQALRIDVKDGAIDGLS